MHTRLVFDGMRLLTNAILATFARHRRPHQRKRYRILDTMSPFVRKDMTAEILTRHVEKRQVMTREEWEKKLDEVKINKRWVRAVQCSAMQCNAVHGIAESRQTSPVCLALPSA